jgi:hypothetical protein
MLLVDTRNIGVLVDRSGVCEIAACQFSEVQPEYLQVLGIYFRSG